MKNRSNHHECRRAFHGPRFLLWAGLSLLATVLAGAGRAEAKAYKGAEVFTLQSVLYGRVEMRMRMMKGSGIVSTFFTYKNGSEVSGTPWEETDIEALGKNDAKTWQSNLITESPRKTSEQLYTEPSSLADNYHTYALEWTPDYVQWTFDGTIVRKTEGGQAANLTNPETLRFNAWVSDAKDWVGALDESALPAYQFVNWFKYYRYENGQFVLDWTDNFDTLDSTRWGRGNWTFDGNLVDFDTDNAVVKDGTLILAITKEDATGFSGTVPVDDGTTVVPKTGGGSDGGCAVGGSQQPSGVAACGAILAALALVVRRRRRDLARSRGVARARLAVAAVLLGVLAPKVASAAVVQGAELYKTDAYFYGRFEARIRYAPGEGVVSSFFLWKDGSSSTTSWNELDFEKINSACRLQTNLWSGTGTQSQQINTPTFDICADYHTYGIEWTPDYIAWVIDGNQVRKETGAKVMEYTKNASQGMQMHFNLWQGDSSFGGTLNTSTLPVHQFISWAQYSSYSNGAFKMEWREDFNDTTVPTGWGVGTWMAPLNHSMHNAANVSIANGIAVMSMTAENMTGYSDTPPADPAGGGTPGTGGAAGTGGMMGAGGKGSGGASTGGAGSGGTGTGSGGSASSGSGGSASSGSGGSASSGSGGADATGSGGSSTGGAVGTGSGGSGSGAQSGSGGASSGSGGATPGGSGGAAASGGASGTGGSTSGGSASGGSSGCNAGGGGPAGEAGPIALLLLVAFALRRPQTIAKRSSHS